MLRDLYVRGKYRDAILPMTVLRRLDAVLEPTKEAVLEMKQALDCDLQGRPAAEGRRRGRGQHRRRAGALDLVERCILLTRVRFHAQQSALRQELEKRSRPHGVVVEYEPDPDLRDSEQIPLLEPGGIDAFIGREVLPHAPDAWYDAGSVRIGYEISLTRYFYKPQRLRTLEEIRADIIALEKETEGLLAEIVGETSSDRLDGRPAFANRPTRREEKPPDRCVPAFNMGAGLGHIKGCL